MIWVTNHSKDSKMEGIQSISTACTMNPICIARMKIGLAVCAHCFSEALLKIRKPLLAHLISNTEILTTRLLTMEEAALVPITSIIGRIESFGDVQNVTQAINFIRIIKAHPHQNFGIWSKNINIWAQAFEKEGKPKNCTYVHSSLYLDTPDFILPRFRKWVDHVFTVWNKKTYDKLWRGHPSECAGIKCMTCLKCYKKGGQYYINERLR